MVRHDLTYHIVSAYQVSWIIRRHRRSQTGTLSGIFCADQPGVKRVMAGLITAAYEDAVERFDQRTQRPWIDTNKRRTGKRKEDDPENGGNGPRRSKRLEKVGQKQNQRAPLASKSNENRRSAPNGGHKRADNVGFL
jgi:hypothetical protein